MTMLSAAQLLQRFDVFGRYREVELGGKVRSMRSHLEIMATELKADPTQHGADCRIRTDDLPLTRRLLYQLS